ncbi:hypothetical protein Tco_0927079 [Tanacetum coccineum]|uniref:Retrotransposon gag domain-containing protein n=1 Tax=Tanacetum coccineum TaxID=301880 RepID=A0ABQ5DBN8_9ASTR
MGTMWCLCNPAPSGRTSILQNDILMFQQHQGESLFETWTRFKDLLPKVPHHGIDLWLQVQIFYDYVNPTTRRTIDQSVGDARLSKFEANFKQQHSEVTNKIDTFLKAINDRMIGALASDTVKNPKFNVKHTSSVLSARSYPMGDSQCSSHIDEV